MFSASPSPMPDSRVRSGAEAVFTSTPTAFTQSSTTASSERDSFTSDRSCWYWPTPIDLGSILTSSASGSCNRRAMDTAPRSETSNSGSSWEAYAEAEYTDAPAAQVDAEVHQDPGTPCPAHGVRQPPVGGPATVGDPEPLGDARLIETRVGIRRRLQRQVEDLLLLAPEHRQDPVRRQLGERLGELEIVGELRARLLLAVAYPGRQPPLRPHLLAQRADQVCVLGEA